METETDTETYRQTIDEAHESCGRVGGRIEGHEEERDSTVRLTESRKLTHRLNHQPKNKHGLDLGSLHICNRSGTWSSWGSPNNWIRGCSQILCVPGLPVYLTEPPYLVSVWEDAPSPAVTWCEGGYTQMGAPSFQRRICIKGVLVGAGLTLGY